MEMQINKLLTMLLIIVLSGCSSSRQHVILGTERYYNDGSLAGGTGFPYEAVDVILDAQVNQLRMRHVRIKREDGFCKSGYLDVIELDGFIGEDSTIMVERMIKRLSPCISDSGKKNPNVVYLNSDGGYLYDGYKMGRLFRENEIKTVITRSQVCASSCAAAFLGGKYRAMLGDAKLLFHSPYTRNGVGINCDNKGHVSGLKGYYNELLAVEDSELLLKRTLSYCSSKNGWTINAGAAVLYNIVNASPYSVEIDN
jgi:ATP-dependent protease ClpP protease subunit